MPYRRRQQIAVPEVTALTQGQPRSIRDAFGLVEDYLRRLAGTTQDGALPLIAEGDLLTLLNGELARVAIGDTGQALVVADGRPVWGDVAGAAGSDILAYYGL